MYCSNCGAEVNERAKFCPQCGNRIGQAPGGSGVRNSAAPPTFSSPAPAPMPPAPATTSAAPAEVQTPRPAPKKKSKAAIAIVAVVVAVVAVLVLFLTGVLGGGGQLASIPAGTYSLSFDNTPVYTLDFDDDGTMSWQSAYSPTETFAFEPAGTVGEGTVFELDYLDDATGSGDLDSTSDMLLLVPNGFATGDPVGAWAIQAVRSDATFTEFFVVGDDGTAVYNGGYGDSVHGPFDSFIEDPQWWEEFFSNPEGGAGTWQRVGDGVYEIMLDGASSPGTIRLPS